MLDLNNVKKYVGRFLFEKDEYGEDPLEYAVEQPLINCIHMVDWLHSLGIYTDESFKEVMDELNESLEYLSRICMDGIDFQSKEIGISKDFDIEDDDKILKISCILFSTYLALNFTECQIVYHFYNPEYNKQEPFEDFDTIDDFREFYEKDFDESKFFRKNFTDNIDFSILKELDNDIYDKIMMYFN